MTYQEATDRIDSADRGVLPENRIDFVAAKSGVVRTRQPVKSCGWNENSGSVGARWTSYEPAVTIQ